MTNKQKADKETALQLGPYFLKQVIQKNETDCFPDKKELKEAKRLLALITDADVKEFLKKNYKK